MKKTTSKWLQMLNVLSQIFFVIFILTGGLIIFHNVYYTPIKIVGASMEPTIHDAQFGVMDTHSGRINKLKRFDIIIVQPDTKVEKYIIKRLIGLPGETLVFDGVGELYINGAHVAQPFIEIEPHRQLTCTGGSKIGCYTSIKLNNQQYYVLGDNRGNSYDSRALGPFNRNHIVGVLFMIEGVCEPENDSSEHRVDLKTCAKRTYQWPIFFSHG